MAIEFDPQEYIAALGSGNMNDPLSNISVIADYVNNNNVNYGSGLLNNIQQTTDPTFTSGLNYAQSIANGQNVPNMIAPGVSYSAANPEGFTQADLNVAVVPPVAGVPDDPAFLPGGSAVNPPDYSNLPLNFIGGGMGDNVTILPPENLKTPPPIDILGMNGFKPTYKPLDLTALQNFIDNTFVKEDVVNQPKTVDFPDNIIGGGMGDNVSILEDETPFIPKDISFPVSDYVVPPVPLNNLLNQNPPTTPVGMGFIPDIDVPSPQEELNDLINMKEVLQEIPADDGVRNLYQVELDNFINESPENLEVYKEELPIGSAINLGIPAVMESVVPMAVPGLGLAQNISNSFQNDFTPSPQPSPSPSTSFTPGIDYSNIYKFGR